MSVKFSKWFELVKKFLFIFHAAYQKVFKMEEMGTYTVSTCDLLAPHTQDVVYSSNIWLIPLIFRSVPMIQKTSL